MPPRRSRIQMLDPVCASLGFLALAAAALAAPPAPAWRAAAPLPLGAAFPTESPQPVGRKLFLLAGASYRINTVLAFDAGAGTWSSRPTQLITNRHHFATAVLDGKLYVAGGCLGETDAVPHRRTNAVESYDPATGHWTPRSPMLTPRQAFQLLALGGRLFAVGGVDQEKTPILTIESYDPASDTWSLHGTAPWGESLEFVQGIVRDGRFYLAGQTKSGPKFLNYDPAANRAASIAAPALDSRRMYAMALAGNEILFIGGGEGKPGTGVLAYNPETAAWRELPALPGARAGAAAVAIDGQVFCIGGWGPEFDWAHPNVSVFALDLAATSAPDSAVQTGSDAKARP